MRSILSVIRSVLFGAQKRRKYAKGVGLNRSVCTRNMHFRYHKIDILHCWFEMRVCVCWGGGGGGGL